MKRSVILVAIILSFVFLPLIATAGGDIFESPTVGFKIVKPASWVFLTADEVVEAKAGVRLDDTELEELIRKRAKTPLVVMTKYPEPYDDLNPSVQVAFNPLGPAKDMPATEILEQTVTLLKRMAEDFTLEDGGIREVEVDGVKGAYLKGAYSVKGPDGREFKTTSRMWFLKRGAFSFIISASGPQSGPDLSEREFADILASVEIAK